MEMAIRKWLGPYFRNSRRWFHRLQQLGLVVGIGPIFATHYFALHRTKIYVNLRMS